MAIIDHHDLIEASMTFIISFRGANSQPPDAYEYVGFDPLTLFIDNMKGVPPEKTLS